MHGVHDHIGNIVYSTVIHVIREIVQMEKPVKEIGANAELGVASIGVAHRGEFPGLEAVKGATRSFIEAGVTVEQPSF